MSRSTDVSLLALVVLVLTGPAPLYAQTVRTRDGSGREIVRRCQPAMSNKELPAVDAVIDSAAVTQRLAELPPGGAASWLLSLGFARDQPTPAVRWLEPETGPDTVLRILSGAARPREAGEAWAVRLRVEPEPRRAIALESAIYCPPQPAATGPSGPVGRRVEIRPGDRMPMPGSKIRMIAEVLVLETGAVADIRLVRGSDIRELDDSFLQHLRQTQFLPALLEGVPVAGRYRTDGSSPRP